MYPLTIFTGSKDGEDPVEFIEDVESQIKADEHTTVAKVEQAIRVQFRTHLIGRHLTGIEATQPTSEATGTNLRQGSWLNSR